MIIIEYLPCLSQWTILWVLHRLLGYHWTCTVPFSIFSDSKLYLCMGLVFSPRIGPVPTFQFVAMRTRESLGLLTSSVVCFKFSRRLLPERFHQSSRATSAFVVVIFQSSIRYDLCSAHRWLALSVSPTQKADKTCSIWPMPALDMRPFVHNW